VARFRFGATFGRRRSGYLALVLLVALLGGLAMGSIAAARRTQSSYPEYLAANRTSQLGGTSAQFLPGQPPPNNEGYAPAIIGRIKRLPHVTHVDSVIGINVLPLDRQGHVANINLDFGLTFAGTLGYGLVDDRVTVLAGHLPSQNARHVFLVDQVALEKLHLHLGQQLTFGIYSNAQVVSPEFGPTTRPRSVFTARLAAVVLSPRDLVQDDVDISSGNVIFTPATTGPLIGCCDSFTETAVGVSGGPAAVSAVQREIASFVPTGFGPFTLTTTAVAKAERAIRPESIAIGAFGVIVALAGLLVAAQLIGRQLRSETGDAAVMRALGADPSMTAADGLVGVLGAVVVGAVLAVGVAVALSPLAPLGPVRPYYPYPGVSFDWTVLGGGFALLVVGLGAVALALVRRYSPRQMATRADRVVGRHSRLLSSVSNSLPAPALVGARFALEPGQGADPVPIRSVMMGSVLALLIVMSAVIFGASLNSLVANPPLYGWNWNYELTSLFGSGNIPAAQSDRLLHADRDVGSFSGAYFDVEKIDGQPVPVLAERPGTPVQPPVLTGHGLETPGQVVLGAVTLADIGKRVGQSVVLSVRDPLTGRIDSARLWIVGTATMPTIGGGGGIHLEMGSGALVPDGAIPAAFRESISNSFASGPDAIFVRLRPGVSESSALPALKRIAGATSNQNNSGVVVKQVERPAEIVNYKTLGATPSVLGATLAGATVLALGLTLLAAVRRRRRDLALLKTLGFTRAQLGATVAAQATVAVMIGIIFGVPLGIVAGRFLWDLFANDIHAVPVPAVSAWTTALIALGALVLGILVSYVPGRIAARTPAAAVLAAE